MGARPSRRFADAGVYDAVKDRLVLGENISQAAQFAESGNADAGILALSLALSPALKEKGRYWRIPENLYTPIQQGAVVLRDIAESAGRAGISRLRSNSRDRPRCWSDTDSFCPAREKP